MGEFHPGASIWCIGQLNSNLSIDRCAILVVPFPLKAEDQSLFPLNFEVHSVLAEKLVAVCRLQRRRPSAADP